MLETIYEVDENIISIDESSKLPTKRSRLPCYLCWGTIVGCFSIITLIIAISLNPFCLLTIKNLENILNIPLNSDDLLKLSTTIINHLDIFSPQVNEQLNLQSNPITYFTSIIPNSSLDILWLYGHLKYPQSCIDNIQCKENFHRKLKLSFTKLSSSLTTIELDSYNDKQIQLHWCSLIENSTTVTLISLLSISIINQSVTETIMSFNRIACKSMDQDILLSKIIDDTIQDQELTTNNPISVILDYQKLTQKTDCNNNSIKNGEEKNMITNNPIDCSKYHDDNNNQHKETNHYSNDISTKFLQI